MGSDRALALRSPELLLGTPCEPERESCSFVAFSPDAKLLVSTAHSGINVWETATGREVKRIDVPELARHDVRLAVSPDHRWLAVSRLLEETEISYPGRR